MLIKSNTVLTMLVPSLALLLFSTDCASTTLTQNASWTIDQPNTSEKYRIVAYGDSIYAGYNGSFFNAAKYSAPTVDGEYLAALWNADIETVRRTKSGAVASDVYQNKIVAERSFMQSTNTRVVTFEMCGNDALQARKSLKGQRGTCNYDVVNRAVDNCKTFVAAAMDFINANAFPGTRVKIISNLYYPGYNADNVNSSCTDPTTRQVVNLRDVFVPALAKMNHSMCDNARLKGFACVDTFAEYMGSDYDSNGDGLIDSQALKYVAGESEASYLEKISKTYRSTLRDANTHFVSSSRSFDYIQSDDTHPTFAGGTVRSGIFGGSNGTGASRYKSFTNGRNPVWNQFGHEQTGWSLSTFNPASPSAATDKK